MVKLPRLLLSSRPLSTKTTTTPVDAQEGNQEEENERIRYARNLIIFLMFS